MKTYEVTLIGSSPLLHHYDNIEFADEMARWRTDPANKNKSKAGDDRSPAHTWIGGLYHDGARLVIPSDNVMSMLKEAGAQVLVPGAKHGKTFKAQTQSGILIEELFWPLLVDGKEIPLAPISGLLTEPDFAVHQERAKELGFSLFVKRAAIGKSKHVRVRARFDRWVTSGRIGVLDDALTKPVLDDIFGIAGRYKGLCDWRPSSKSPGPFGRFGAVVKEVK
jgi:hypothetical protein